MKTKQLLKKCDWKVKFSLFFSTLFFGTQIRFLDQKSLRQSGLLIVFVSDR